MTEPHPDYRRISELEFAMGFSRSCAMCGAVVDAIDTVWVTDDPWFEDGWICAECATPTED